MPVMRVTEPFSCDMDGVPRVFAAGALVDSKHPVVKGRERFFVDAEEYVARSAKNAAGATETATSAPGERRSRTAAQKRAAKKAVAKKAVAKKAARSGADDGQPDPESGPSQIPGVNRDPSADVPAEGDGSADDTSGPNQIPGPNDDPDAKLPESGSGSADKGVGGPGDDTV